MNNEQETCSLTYSRFGKIGERRGSLNALLKIAAHDIEENEACPIKIINSSGDIVKNRSQILDFWENSFLKPNTPTKEL
jgi:hypothetical protein